MPNAILDGLSLVDSMGRTILAATLVSLVGAIGAHIILRSRYGALQRDLEQNAEPEPRFTQPVLHRIFRAAEEDARRSKDRNTQAIVEDAFQSDLRSLLLLERFVRAATGLVLILGLLGTFYGLTLSIGKLVHLVSADTAVSSDVTQALTDGLSQSLAGMAAAFSNSLVGVASAVLLTLIGVVNNVTDRRTALMIRIETVLDRLFAARAHDPGDRRVDTASVLAGFGESVRQLDGAVARFEAALQHFSASTKDLREVHLVVALKPGERP